MKNNKKRGLTLIILLLLAMSLLGCNKLEQVTRFTYAFDGAFDTSFQFIAYCQSQEEFDQLATHVQQRMEDLHIQFDKFNPYPGVKNLHYVNAHAGTEQVKIDQELYDLLEFSISTQEEYSKKTNIALGTVLELWSHYRDFGLKYPEEASLPLLEDLKEAQEHTKIKDVILDKETSSVYFTDPKLKLDVGAVAKGYATELIAQELKDLECNSFILGSGGNIKIVGEPIEPNRKKWSIGLQDPDRYLFGSDRTLDKVFVTDTSVVSSGDYQRYYYVEDQLYHHIIDPDTLFPGNYYRAVYVFCEDSGLADFFSTELFLLPFAESKALAERVEGLEAQWIFPDLSIEMTEGFRMVSESQGAKPN
ncbi:MAG: FAD:protein FMN transferase [Firmicutes bacterium]|nr:FAD:protein FMN transferase [Bacillota bacterium]